MKSAWYRCCVGVVHFSKLWTHLLYPHPHCTILFFFPAEDLPAHTQWLVFWQLHVMRNQQCCSATDSRCCPFCWWAPVINILLELRMTNMSVLW